MINASSYTNNLTGISKTRIMADRNLVINDREIYNDSEIYFIFNEETIDNIFKILIIGSSDHENPYFGGFFFFGGEFPDQYPFFPPRILSKTQGENMRFHPNYYTNGKCCLSILGTWSGPPWTSCQNIGTISHTLKSLYIQNPIIQEPGWEKKAISKESELYSRMIEYRTLEIGVIRMLENPPNEFKEFLPIMQVIFLKNYKVYLNKIEKLRYLHNTTDKLELYNITVNYNITELKLSFDNLFKKLNIKLPRVRKSPNVPASNFDNGYIQVSENDHNNWIVRETKNGRKRWFIHTN